MEIETFLPPNNQAIMIFGFVSAQFKNYLKICYSLQAIDGSSAKPA